MIVKPAMSLRLHVVLLVALASSLIGIYVGVQLSEQTFSYYARKVNEERYSEIMLIVIRMSHSLPSNLQAEEIAAIDYRREYQRQCRDYVIWMDQRISTEQLVDTFRHLPNSDIFINDYLRARIQILESK